MSDEVPFGHGVVALEPLMATWLPAAASLHSLEPSSSAYVPTAHGSQGPTPAPLDVPGGHAVHLLAPLEELE